MVITCPNCGSTFNLPESRVDSEARARCSVCGHIFQLRQGMPGATDNHFISTQPAAEGPIRDLLSEVHDSPAGQEKAPEPSAPSHKPPQVKKGGKGKIIILLVLILAILGGAGYYFLFSESGPSGKEAVSERDKARQVEKISIIRRRQYLKENQHLGKIIVIDGMVANKGDKPKNFIKLEAALLDPQGNVLMSKQFFCGPELKQAQLETMGEVEMEKWLTNETEVFKLNTNVRKDDQVPFMVVFYRPPAELLESAEGYSYRLTVVDAPDAEGGAK